MKKGAPDERHAKTQAADRHAGDRLQASGMVCPMLAAWLDRGNYYAFSDVKAFPSLTERLLQSRQASTMTQWGLFFISNISHAPLHVHLFAVSQDGSFLARQKGKNSHWVI